MSTEALKLALEALEKGVCVDPEDSHRAIYAIREALAQQPAQKRPQNCGTGYCSCIECVMEPQQEPVAYRSRLESGSYTYCNTAQFFDNAEPLYTSPPARKPLTDEEIEQCMKQAYSTAQGRLLEHAFARAIEAAHGIYATTEMKESE